MTKKKSFSKSVKEMFLSQHIVYRLLISTVENYTDIVLKLDIKRKKYNIDEYIYHMIMMEVVDMDTEQMLLLMKMMGD